MPKVLQSRKLVAAIVGLVLMIVAAISNRQAIDPNTLVNAIMVVVSAYMGAVALEDGMTQRNANKTTVTTPGTSDVTVSQAPEATQPPQPMIGRMG